MTTARKAVPAAQPRQRQQRRRFREELMAGLVLLLALLVTLLLLSLQWLHGASSATTLPHLTTTHGGLV